MQRLAALTFPQIDARRLKPSLPRLSGRWLQLRVYALLLLALGGMACIADIDLTTSFRDVHHVTHDLEYRYHIEDGDPEPHEAGADDLSLFDTPYCDTSDFVYEVIATCVGLPHGLVIQHAASGAAEPIDIDVSRTDLGDQWGFRVEMLNPFTDLRDELYWGRLAWVVYMPGVIVDSNGNWVSEDDGRVEFRAGLYGARETFFAVSIQDKGETPATTEPSSPYLCDNGVAVPQPAQNQGLVEDCEALLELRDILSGDVSLNWHPNRPMSMWEGVATDGLTKRVTGLYLYNRGLTGTLPSQLGEISALEHLWLHNNRLSGEIPPALGALVGLNELLLGGNRLTGSIPSELGELSRLEYLSLSKNRLTGQLPAELSRLSQLRELWLYDNALTGVIPAELRELRGLTRLSLSNNQLMGSVPAELGDLYRLRQLWLQGNNLTGAIPGKIAYLSQLRELWLYDNDLTGEIPAELGALRDVRHISISANQLSGEIPPELGNLYYLELLNLSDNQLSGEIPAELGDLSSLGALDLSDNQLTGGIHPSLGGLYSLEKLYLCGNMLTGTLPTEFGDLSDLETDGCIPPSQASAVPPELNREVLVALYHATDGPNWTDSTNWLTDAPLDEWYGVYTHRSGRVAVLDLSFNELSGEIPPELGNLASLWHLDLSGNQLSGEIPPELGNLAELGSLDLNGSRLSGEIPSELENLYYLWLLDLSDNRLSSEIASSLGSLANLEELYLSSNQLSGSLPSSFTQLTALEGFAFGDNAGLCAPTDAAFQKWLTAIPNNNLPARVAPLGPDCGAATSIVDDVEPGDLAAVSPGYLLSAGYHHTCRVETDGSVSCWGSNFDGEAVPPDGEFAAVSVGAGYACGVRTDGSVACWGDDRLGQATPPEGTFTSVSAGIDSLGGSYACGVGTDGSVACWGDDYAGEATPPDGRFTSVSAGPAHTCGVRIDGYVACWGTLARGLSALSFN